MTDKLLVVTDAQTEVVESCRGIHPPPSPPFMHSLKIHIGLKKPVWVCVRVKVKVTLWVVGFKGMVTGVWGGEGGGGWTQTIDESSQNILRFLF